MKQRLEIKNFGPVREVNLDIDDYMVFIGPNAAGKSTIAKLVYFFRSFGFDYNDILTLDSANDNYYAVIFEFVEQIIQERFSSFWDIESLQDDFTVSFYPAYDEKDSEHLFICLKKSSANLSIEWSKRFKNIINEQIDHDHKNFLEKNKERLFLEGFVVNIPRIFNDYFRSNDEYCFIPAGRQILSLPTDNMPLFNDGRFDYLLGDFMSLVKENKPSFNVFIDEFEKQISKKYWKGKMVRNKNRKTNYLNTNYLKVNNETFDLTHQLIDKILKGKYISTREGERIYLNEKQFVKLYEASSGQQEVLWILNIILLLILVSEDSSPENKNKNITIIEEPETHLFPETQRDITNLISLLANRKNQQVIITTHSPYILTALNNLLYAHKLGQKKPEETAAKINPLLWIDDNRLAVYMVENGTIRNIIDHELEMISTEEIDYVSRIINGEFDDLFDLKYS
ncbi:MAG: AAA family ATPase [Planctomycetaceae bacterium]|jgi:energy-coupling factor transporter ATP-binding protein EcfA2|nr:AAA family ATPase [Planctomycetaceae bacterium]